jgi:FKBP-type peptidyl-prolyl cis-trans isomerase
VLANLTPESVLILLFASLLALSAPDASQQLPAPTGPAIVTTASGLRFQTVKPATGPRPASDDAVLIAYEGRLADGTVFDKSEQPVGMMVSGVIPGFQEALLLMNQGGTYRFWIPASLAYGAQGAGGGAIPPNAELDFTVTLVDIGRPTPAPAAPAQPSSTH